MTEERHEYSIENRRWKFDGNAIEGRFKSEQDVSEFQRFFLNVPQQEDPLRKFAEEYHRRCDAFDNTVCTGRSKHGEKCAANGDELMASNRNARSIRKEIAQREGIPINDLRDAIFRYRPKK